MNRPSPRPVPKRRLSRSRLLDLVLAAGLADTGLLAVLLYFAFVHRDKAIVSVIGTVHGINFLLLLALTGYGAFRHCWRWWFPLAVLLTFGPPGSIVGDLYLRHRNQPAHDASGRARQSIRTHDRRGATPGKEEA